MFGKDSLVLNKAYPLLVEHAFGRISIIHPRNHCFGRTFRIQGGGKLLRSHGSLLQEFNPGSYGGLDLGLQSWLRV